MLDARHIDSSIVGYRDYGWRNGDDSLGEIIATCISLNHHVRRMEVSRVPHRNTDMLDICDDCRYFTHTDASDG